MRVVTINYIRGIKMSNQTQNQKKRAKSFINGNRIFDDRIWNSYIIKRNSY